jgi:putative ABC transport system permease protein
MICISESLEVALQSLFRNKLRAFLTMLGIIIGVSSVILLISIGSGLQSYVTGQFESLGSNLLFVTAGSEDQKFGQGFARQVLTQKDVKAIKRIGYPIENATGFIALFAKIKYRTKEKTISINATDENGIKMSNYKAKIGRIISQEEVEKGSYVTLLGPDIAKELFGNANPVGKNVLLQSSKYKVIGVFESKGGAGVGSSPDEEIFIPITTAQKQFNHDKLTLIYVKVAKKEELPNAKDKIIEKLLKSYDKDDFSVRNQADLLTTINQILGVITAGLGGIAAISLLVGGIGIMNIMFVTVTERTREIGLRKAVGAKPSDILIQFLIESVVLSVIGGAIGILLAMGGSLIISKFLSSEITPSAIALAFGFSTTIGIIFGVVPAYKAAKLNPINALRYE